MKLAFMVNEVSTEVDEYTTTRLARAAARKGHEVWYLGVGDVRYRPDDCLSAGARRAEYESGDELSSFLERVKEDESRETLVLDHLDAVMLRNDSVADLHERPWAVNAGVEFGYVLDDRGVTVVNEPAGMARAASKLYLEEFPRDIRPASLISRDEDEITTFIQDRGPTVLKPLYGAQGRNVFMVEDHTDANLSQIVEAVLQDGYVVAQAKVGDASDGDMRLFLLDGEPLHVDGAYAAFRRVPRGHDQRANVSTGGKPEPAEVGKVELDIAQRMRERLLRDGMFLVGIDIIGDKVIEINVESPGGFQAAEHFTGVDFSAAVIDALERRVASR